ncbi:hypothetical protein V6N13_104629 [Hibiscus sabdariffa]
MRILPVARKGRPKIMGALSSTSQSKIKKSAENTNLPTLTRRSSTFPSGLTCERSANWRITVVGLATPMPSFMKTDLGIKFTLDPRSHNALPI